MKSNILNNYKNQLSEESKNGVDFTISGMLIWAIISVIWASDLGASQKSVYVFIAGTPMLPLAFLLSKVLKTNWKIEGNPLQPLGLWLNIAQLFYFPFLIFILIRMPEYFLMTYAIITGAHFFPYSWFFNTRWYAIFAGIISVGSFSGGLFLTSANHYLIGVLCSACLAFMSIGLVLDFRSKRVHKSLSLEIN